METVLNRDVEIDEAIQTAQATTDGVVWDITGVHGTGKSTLLGQIIAIADEPTSRIYTIAVSMQEEGIDERFRGDVGGNAGNPARLATLLAAVDLLMRCSAQLDKESGGDRFASFREHARKINADADQFSRQVENDAESLFAVKARHDIHELQEALDDAFVEAWTLFTKPGRQVVLALDQFTDVAATQFGYWLVSLALRLPRTLTLIARSPVTTDHLPTHARIRRLPLGHFTVAQVHELLRRRLPDHEISGEVAKMVHTFTDGHPGGTRLLADLIWEQNEGVDPKALRRILDRMPDDPAERWATIVRKIVDAVRFRDQDRQLADAVDAAAVVTSFDSSMLAALLADGGPPAGGRLPGDRSALSLLREHRLVRPVGDNQPDGFRMVEFIRASLANDLRANHAGRWSVLHRRAAAHLARQLDADEEDNAGWLYNYWYRYERPKWQRDKRRWMYHAAHCVTRRKVTRLQLVLLFMEAFWWWGYYHPFDFMERLVEDWDQIWRASTGLEEKDLADDKQLGVALRTILHTYPPGFPKPPNVDWEGVLAALAQVLDLCGVVGRTLPRPRPDSGAQDREEYLLRARVRALVRIFSAQAHRFRDPSDDIAEHLYGEAIKSFEWLKDRWTVAWLQSEIADLALERGEPQRAAERVAVSAATLVSLSANRDFGDPSDFDRADFDPADDADDDSEPDYELRGILHRIRADVHVALGADAAAAVEYGRAAADAYLFQGHPHPPDEYTRRFYCEIVGRVAAWLIAVAETDLDRAVELARAVQKASVPAAGGPRDPRPALGRRDPAQVCADLFPAEPAADELGTRASGFLDRWRAQLVAPEASSQALRELANPSMVR